MKKLLMTCCFLLLSQVAYAQAMGGVAQRINIPAALDAATGATNVANAIAGTYTLGFTVAQSYASGCPSSGTPAELTNTLVTPVMFYTIP